MEDKVIKTYIDYIVFIEDPILDCFYWVKDFSEDDGHTKTEAIDYAKKLAVAIENDGVGVWVEKRLVTEYEDFGPDGGEGDPNPQVVWKSYNLEDVDVGKGEFDIDDYPNLPKEFISNNKEQNENEESTEDEVISTSTDWHVFVKDLKSGNYDFAKEFSPDWNNTKEDAIKYAQQINEKTDFATWVTQVIVTTYRDFGPDGGEGDPNPQVVWKSPELKNVKDSDLEQGDFVTFWDEDSFKGIFTESIKENLSNVKFEWVDKQAEVIFPFEETDEKGYLLVDYGASIYNTLVANDLVNINIDVLVDFDDVDVDYDSGYEKSDWWQTAIDTSGYIVDFNSVNYKITYEVVETGDLITIDEAAATLGITKDELQAEVDRRCKELYETSVSKVEDIYLDDLKEREAEAEADAKLAAADWYDTDWD